VERVGREILESAARFDQPGDLDLQPPEFRQINADAPFLQVIIAEGGLDVPRRRRPSASASRDSPRQRARLRPISVPCGGRAAPRYGRGADQIEDIPLRLVEIDARPT